LRRPLSAARPAFELDELLVALEDGPAADDGEAAAHLREPAVGRAGRRIRDIGESAGADVSASGPRSLDGADSSVAVQPIVGRRGGLRRVVRRRRGVDSIAAELSSAIDAEKRSPATRRERAPAKNKRGEDKGRGEPALAPLGSPDSASSGDGLPPKSQFSLRVNHRGIAVSSFWIEPLAATRGAELAC
jgi:hypothetical protein